MYFLYLKPNIYVSCVEVTFKFGHIFSGCYIPGFMFSQANLSLLLTHTHTHSHTHTLSHVHVCELVKEEASGVPQLYFLFTQPTSNV
jgi:hypothetical protein